mmetsp:Transcript_18372/g.39500  ORF Transcript_18372/g.39500 Transcript_18372/m.39500 type:complete len:570 (-) Transcript_18372:261-1970(-)
MPELPEVEAARSLVHNYCYLKTIRVANVAEDEKVVEGIPPSDLAKVLNGKIIKAACRKAKHLWLEFQNDSEDRALLLHFGMTGSIIIKTPSGEMLAAKYERIDADTSGTWPPKYWKLDLELDDGTRLAFTDPRRFARVRLLSDPLSKEPLVKLAHDALTQLPQLEEFRAALAALSRKKTLKIKALLLDQEAVVSGVGNWVADEVLYQARVHPEQAVIDMSPEQVEAVHSALHSVVQHAVQVDADSAMFPRDWIFHYRWTNKRASSINGMPISFVTVGSRTSAFVPALQKLRRSTGEMVEDTGDDGGEEGGKPVKKAKAKPKAKKGKAAEGDDDEHDDGNDGSKADNSDAEAPAAGKGKAKQPAKRERKASDKGLEAAQVKAEVKAEDAGIKGKARQPAKRARRAAAQAQAAELQEGEVSPEEPKEGSGAEQEQQQGGRGGAAARRAAASGGAGRQPRGQKAKSAAAEDKDDDDNRKAAGAEGTEYPGPDAGEQPAAPAPEGGGRGKARGVERKAAAPRAGRAHQARTQAGREQSDEGEVGVKEGAAGEQEDKGGKQATASNKRSRKAAA